MYVFKFWNTKLPNLSDYIILVNIFNINTKNRLFNFSVFNFRVESSYIHTRFSSTIYLHTSMCILLYVYIYYIPTYFSFLRCRIYIYIFCPPYSLQYTIDVLYFYDLFGGIYRQPTTVFQTGTPCKKMTHRIRTQHLWDRK